MSVRVLWQRFSELSIVTELGWTVLASSLAAWLAGAWLGWIELILAAATGLLVLLFGVFFTIGRTRLTVGIEPRRRRVTVGESTKVGVLVTNTAKRPMLPLALEIVVGPAPQPFDLPALAGGGGWHRLEFEVHGLRRGVIAIGPATTVRGDPLGLMQRRVSSPEVTEVLVHPITTRLEPLGHGLLRDLEGLTTNDLSMSDLAFHTLREYVPGDDRRYIHWRSSAKSVSAVPGGKFLIRQFRDTRRTHLLVIVDGNRASYPDPEDFELAVSVGASVAGQAVDDSFDATLVVADRWSRRESGRRQTRQKILDTCSRAELGSRPLAELVAQGIRLARDATFAVLVTGSNVSYLNLRRIIVQLPTEVRTTAIQVDPSARQDRPAPSGGSSLSMLTLAQLRDLRPLLSRGGVR